MTILKEFTYAYLYSLSTEGSYHFHLFQVDVCASMKEAVYTCILCFDTKGSFLAPPYSNGICIASELVCSHQITVLFYFTALQREYYKLNGIKSFAKLQGKFQESVQQFRQSVQQFREGEAILAEFMCEKYRKTALKRRRTSAKVTVCGATAFGVWEDEAALEEEEETVNGQVTMSHLTGAENIPLESSHREAEEKASDDDFAKDSAEEEGGFNG